MTDDQLRHDVEEELTFDPKLDSAAISVSAQAGVVTLRGTVGSYRERREATTAAKRLRGVARVENELQVRLLDADRREDADLRGSVLQALTLDALVPSTVDAKVRDRHVTLTGTAHYQFEREEAELVAGNVLGVMWVDDDIAVVPPGPSAGDVKHAIRQAMVRDAKLDADSISVETHDGTVSLSGPVGSWAEHDAAVAAAWAAPGVSRVDDALFIDY